MGLVDPDRRRRGGWLRQAADEAFGMLRVGGRKHAASSGDPFGGSAAMHVGRSEQAETAVMVLEVVPMEEVLAVAARVLGCAEAVGKARAVLERGMSQKRLIF